ncbi:diguanylate cyclase [Bacillus sp. BRMEA1]|uniref:sensor domain-containing diguanylate cyclase n=1 Tax=Neobacillus endophyticus TaxID=2738405 RepID=UPI001566EB27|nr:sensor domain-containing diguanylate cyclase [Neobacillus endophyticus]NRD76017.1 diguanylate cyclase [Neobacillus endophyticus]
MQVKPQIKRMIFLIWILLVPTGMWYTYRAYPPHISGHWLEAAAFLLLTCLVASMPIVINEMFIFLIQWVTLVVFLKFGLFMEMLFAQIAFLVLSSKLRILRKDQLFRLPINSNMFFLVSFISGVIYYLLGGHTGPDIAADTSSLRLTILYAVLYYAVNQVIFSFILYFIYNIKESYFGKDFYVETLTTIITFPIGIVLYILYYQFGLLAIVFVGIPFVSLSIIFNLYYSSQKINEYLQKAAEIGHQMAERLKVDDVIDLFLQKFSEMLPVDYAYIFEATGEELILSRGMEAGKVMDTYLPAMKKNEDIFGMVWAKEKSYLFKSSNEWKTYTKGYMPYNAESILSVPIIRNKKVIGVLLLASKRKRAYEKYQLMIADILCSYFAVAMENAKHYELAKMQSERCALTKLYNYRYFENVLTYEFDKLFNFERNMLSIIILDIDHFKSVNDNYGHQSGNEVLCELASRLSKLLGETGTIARYGGEEFVVLLPDTPKNDAINIAERIRQSIANWPFTITQSLEHDHKQQQIKITASIGVASAPEDAEDYLSLIRHADRALYVGAKRAGRNRVAEYSSC